MKTQNVSSLQVAKTIAMNQFVYDTAIASVDVNLEFQNGEVMPVRVFRNLKIYSVREIETGIVKIDAHGYEININQKSL